MIVKWNIVAIYTSLVIIKTLKLMDIKTEKIVYHLNVCKIYKVFKIQKQNILILLIECTVPLAISCQTFFGGI